MKPSQCNGLSGFSCVSTMVRLAGGFKLQRPHVCTAGVRQNHIVATTALLTAVLVKMFKGLPASASARGFRAGSFKDSVRFWRFSSAVGGRLGLAALRNQRCPPVSENFGPVKQTPNPKTKA